MKGLMYGLAIVDVSEEAVVRANEEMIVGFDDDWAAGRSDAWINNSDVNRPARKCLVGREQHERTGFDVLRRDLVGDVYDSDVRIDRQNRAFDGAHEIISRPEVGEQGDNGENRHLRSSQSGRVS